jgi:GNAT superfamily N-acetyltransferase
VYVFEEDGHVLGYTQVRVDPDALELDNIVVAGEHQLKGIGKAMVDFVENLAKNLVDPSDDKLTEPNRVPKTEEELSPHRRN